MNRLLQVLLLSLLSGGTLQAQDQSQQNSVDDPQQEQVQLDAELTPEELAAAEADALVLDPDDAEDADEEAERSSSRFIPTEQISQDLGVSFPVDI